MSEVESTRVSWAPVIATTVGMGSVPEPTVAQVNQITLSDFMTDLKNRDVAFQEGLMKDLEDYKTILTSRMMRDNITGLLVLSKEFEAKIEAVRQFRKETIEAKRKSIEEKDSDEINAYRNKLRADNLLRITKCSTQLSSSEISELVLTLDEVTQKHIHSLEIKKKLQREKFITELQISAQEISWSAYELHVTKQRQAVEQLRNDLDAAADFTRLIVQFSDIKFRAMICSRMANESDFTVKERSRLIELRDNARDKLVIALRMKEFTQTCKMNVQVQQIEIEIIKDICIKCFGFEDQKAILFFKSCNIVPPVCHSEISDDLEE